MKRNTFMLIALVLAFAVSSCFLLPQDVSQTEVEEFISDFEDDMNGGLTEVEGENTQLAMAAATDFFSKGGTAVDYLIPFNMLNGNMDTKLLLDTVYGTYEYDTTAYDFVLVDGSTPTDGYKFIWTFVDSLGTSYDVALTFDQITYYAGDPDEETPTNLHIGMSIDDVELVYIDYSATYTTEQDSFGTDEYVPITMSVTWGVTDEYNITIAYEGHTEDDTDGYILVVDEASFRVEDEINDEWVEYTVTSTSDETVNLVVEYSEGWKFDIDTEAPVEFNATYNGEPVVYTRVDFTGELTKSGVHAADIEGIMYDTDPYYDMNYQSYMTLIYPDGSEEDIDINLILPVVK